MSDIDSRPEPVEETLARLPHRGSSPEFTATVLESIDRRRRSAPSRRSILGWSAATALAVGLLLSAAVAFQRHRAAGQAYLEQVEELRSEYRLLREEVATVRRQVAEPAPFLYLGGDEQVDLVLDLGRPGRPGEVRPASQLSRAPTHEIRPATYDQ